MARIAGITVEIGSDVGPLSRALESVNKTIKTTGTQFKDVERLLKLDPSNTVLLTQKQETLKEKIQEFVLKLTSFLGASQCTDHYQNVPYIFVTIMAKIERKADLVFHDSMGKILTEVG